MLYVTYREMQQKIPQEMFLGTFWGILCWKRQRMLLGMLRAMLWEKFGECQENSVEGAPGSMRQLLAKTLESACNKCFAERFKITLSNIWEKFAVFSIIKY